MFVHFVCRWGRNLLVNVKDITLVIQKGVFCEIHIRDIEGHVIIEGGLTNVCRKVKEAINTSINISARNGYAPEFCD